MVKIFKQDVSYLAIKKIIIYKYLKNDDIVWIKNSKRYF